MTVTLTLRSDKGAPLTAAEVDGNFQSLAEAVAGLEGEALIGEGLESVVVDGFEVTLIGSRGTHFGTLALPMPTPRGAWAEGASYAPLDLVSQGGDGYAALVAHTAGADFQVDLDDGKWALLVARGEPGTAVTWRGAWAAGTAYAQGDGVRHEGDLFVALTADTGTEPPDDAIWRRIGPADQGGVDAGAVLILSSLME